MEITINIKNFALYLPRKDLVSTKWVRFDVDLLTHPDFFELTGNEFKVFFHFIQIAGKMRSAAIRMNINHTAHILKVEFSDVVSAITKLEGKRWSCDDNISESLESHGSARICVGNSKLLHESVPRIEENRIEENRIEYSAKKNKKANPGDSAKTQAFIAGYCERFKSRYGFNPDLDGAEVGVCKRLAKSLSLDKINLYLDGYFSIPDPWLVKQKHPIKLIPDRKNQIRSWMETGTFVTNQEVNRVDHEMGHMKTHAKKREEILSQIDFEKDTKELPEAASE